VHVRVAWHAWTSKTLPKPQATPVTRVVNYPAAGRRGRRRGAEGATSACCYQHLLRGCYLYPSRSGCSPRAMNALHFLLSSLSPALHRLLWHWAWNEDIAWRRHSFIFLPVPRRLSNVDVPSFDDGPAATISAAHSRAASTALARRASCSGVKCLALRCVAFTSAAQEDAHHLVAASFRLCWLISPFGGENS